MTDNELFEHNASIMEQMDSETAAIIQATLRSLNRTSTRIQLRNPHNHGNSVNYDLVRGETKFVKACGRANGVSVVTDDLLEVSS
jgi:hypothetical protein